MISEVDSKYLKEVINNPGLFLFNSSYEHERELNGVMSTMYFLSEKNKLVLEDVNKVEDIIDICKETEINDSIFILDIGELGISSKSISQVALDLAVWCRKNNNTCITRIYTYRTFTENERSILNIIPATSLVYGSDFIASIMEKGKLHISKNRYFIGNRYSPFNLDI